MSRLRFRSLGGEGDVLELDFHRLALVNLEGDDALFRRLGGVIGDVGGELAVDEMLHVVALGDDFVIVPVVLIDCSLDFFAVAGGASDCNLGLGIYVLLKCLDEANGVFLRKFQGVAG